MLVLPELAKIPEDALAQVPELFKIFRKDFIDNITYFMAYPVIVPRPIKNEKYPEIFWHIISRQEQKGSRSNDTRGIDYERAKRLCWIKPIIQQFRDKEITCWRAKEFDRKAGKENYRYYFWYKNGKFIVILKCVEKRAKKFYIATAFYVFENNVEYYEKLYTEGEKIDCWA